MDINKSKKVTIFKRVCDHKDCDVYLSVYNNTDWCGLHEAGHYFGNRANEGQSRRTRARRKQKNEGG